MKKIGIITAIVLCVAVCVIAAVYFAGSADAQDEGGTPSGGKTVLNGFVTENGATYLYSEGNKLTGLQEFEGKVYYLGDSGELQKGLVRVGDYSFYFDSESGARLENAWSCLEGQHSYMIKVNKSQNVVTVYASDGEGGYSIPVTAFLCSTGDSTPLGEFPLALKWDWLWMVDDSWGMWVSQITGNYLFHSVPYWGTKDREQLDVGEFNKLGTTCSHGCIRLRAGDAKWIYDNIPEGSTVVIYEDENPSPFGKPEYEKLPDWHTWDPTDPAMSQKCAEHGCH